MLPSVVILQQYFKRRRALTAGLASTGASLAGFAIGPVNRVLVDRFGWRTTLVIHACVFLQAAVIGATFRPLPVEKPTETIPLEEECVTTNDGQEEDIKPQQKKKSLLTQLVDLNLLRSKQFVLYMVAMFAIHYSLNTMYSLGPSRAVSQGMDKLRASLLPSTIALPSLVSRLLNSVIANMKCTQLFVQLGVLSVCTGLAVCFSCTTQSFEGSVAFCALYGICAGESFKTGFYITLDISTWHTFVVEWILTS